MNKVQKAAKTLGKIGGKMGTGNSKVRGDATYYKKIRAKRNHKNILKNNSPAQG